MNKINIKEIIDFRRKSIKAKHTFAQNLNKENLPSEGGGDYWISSVSALARAFKTNNNDVITEKVIKINKSLDSTIYERTKLMYQRNIDILNNYKDFDFDAIKPTQKLTYHKKSKSLSILMIDKVPIKISPNHIFSYNENGKKIMGGIWFIAKLGGLKDEELAMVSDVLYRYLQANYSVDYEINPEFCIAVDVNNCKEINFRQLLTKEMPAILLPTLDSLKAMLAEHP